MGKAWTFGENLNTDEIIPGRFNITIDPLELAKNVFCEIKPEYAKNVKAWRYRHWRAKFWMRFLARTRTACHQRVKGKVHHRTFICAHFLPQCHEMLVDTCAMELVHAPEQFEVIVTTNLFGGILSDEASMLVGGLGVAASGNIGADAAVFEPVHGSAPTLAGTGKANPIATILAAAMMLDFIGEKEQALRIQNAVENSIKDGQVTADMGGVLTTDQATKNIIQRL